MWSRNGTPVAKSARPSPSRLTSTAICVSFVLRSTLAVRAFGMAGPIVSLSYRFQRRDHGVVLGGGADGHAQAVREQRVPAVQVLHQDAGGEEVLEPAGCVGH